MYPSKFFYCLIITVFISVSNVFAIENLHVHVEPDYAELQQLIRNLIIRETVKSNDIQQKAVSLEYIKDSLSEKQPIDNTYFLYRALKYLAFEGTINIKTTNNAPNDFPGIRREAVKLLGELGIIEARIALMEVLKHETNQLVLYEAAISLFFRWPNSYQKRVYNIKTPYAPPSKNYISEKKEEQLSNNSIKNDDSEDVTQKTPVFSGDGGPILEIGDIKDYLSYKPDDEQTADIIVFETFSDADFVKISASSSSLGIAAEYAWIRYIYPNYSHVRQMLIDIKINGKTLPCDLLIIKNKAGEVKYIYFEISDFFGKWK